MLCVLKVKVNRIIEAEEVTPKYTLYPIYIISSPFLRHLEPQIQYFILHFLSSGKVVCSAGVHGWFFHLAAPPLGFAQQLWEGSSMSYVDRLMNVSFCFCFVSSFLVCDVLNPKDMLAATHPVPEPHCPHHFLVSRSPKACQKH